MRRRDFLKLLGLAPVAAVAGVAALRLGDSEAAWRKWVGESAEGYVRDMDQDLANCAFNPRYATMGRYATKPEGTPVQFDDPPYLTSDTAWKLRKDSDTWFKHYEGLNVNTEGWRISHGRAR
ncbi:MAG: twin-arginine translocation signal domain-containing protein [Deltaproteobacteria bacterium]|nr:twin-arginine translocation signal domain-containing protein [Deltaproteobacteria bacterium]